MEQSGGASAHPVLDLFHLARLPPRARLAIAVVSVVAAVGWGLAALSLHDRYAGLRAGGQALGPVPSLFADGASALTAWPGWAAALFFGYSVLRLRTGDPEPPAGHRDDATMSIAQLRAGLRREYSAVRAALLAVTAVTVLDLGRLSVSAVAAVGDHAQARAGLGWMLAEASGLVVASAMLALWARAFRSQLEQVGAI